jgi:transposase
MTGLVRARYTLEFKQEAVRLVRGGQTVSSVAKTLGLSDQTLHNWLKAEAAGGLREITGKVVSAEQMEIASRTANLFDIYVAFAIHLILTECDRRQIPTRERVVHGHTCRYLLHLYIHNELFVVLLY